MKKCLFSDFYHGLTLAQNNLVSMSTHDLCANRIPTVQHKIEGKY